MKSRAVILIFIATLVASCNTDHQIQILVSNPLDTQRDDASIILNRGEISNWTEIPDGKLPLLEDAEGNPLPCQVDDVDKDGIWDELFTLTDLEPSGQKTLILKFIDPAKYPSFEVRTNVRLGSNTDGYPELERADRLEGVSYHNYSNRTGEVYQMEGPAWESDRVGFRNYLDQRNGMDIFGKLTTKMVLDSVGIAGRQSYHEPDEWGMDVLKVGASLGSGAIAYMHNDSLYRVGDNGTGTYELILEGPLRSLFSLKFMDWRIEDVSLDVSHQISIIAGGYYYESAVVFNGTEAHLDLVPGIVNMKSDTLYIEHLNDHFTALLTHDYQAEDTTLLGMALMVPREILDEYGKTRDQGEGIIHTYFAKLAAQPGLTIPFRFYAFWEQENPRWSSCEEIILFLKTEAEQWAHPVTFRLSSE